MFRGVSPNVTRVYRDKGPCKFERQGCPAANSPTGLPARLLFGIDYIHRQEVFRRPRPRPLPSYVQEPARGNHSAESAVWCDTQQSISTSPTPDRLTRRRREQSHRGTPPSVCHSTAAGLPAPKRDIETDTGPPTPSSTLCRLSSGHATRRCAVSVSETRSTRRMMPPYTTFPIPADVRKPEHPASA